jgi:hypothetical protein|tara:strand:+ start:455 stop:739 length:285 start_codon:yes stop_codon:yes gene_type:complete
MPDEKKFIASLGNEMSLNEAVNNPNHYNQGALETIDLIKESMTKEEFAGYLRGNILKYVCRYNYKGTPLKDLMKADWYLKKLMYEVREKGSNDK